MEPTRIEAEARTATAPQETSPAVDSTPEPPSRNATKPEPLADTSKPSESIEAKPPSIDVLRRKLDAAIVAEAWDAVKAIRERIVEAEREAAGNVVAFDARRRK